MAYKYAGVEPKYMTDDKKRFRMANLFFETNTGLQGELDIERKVSEFTLKPYDYTDNAGRNYPSAKLMFMQIGDVTGYRFAMEVLGSWEHYLQLREHKRIGPHIIAWEDELKANLESEAINDIQGISANGGSQAQLAAAKYILTHEYDKKSIKARRSEETGKQMNNDTMSPETRDDMERLGLTVHSS